WPRCGRRRQRVLELNAVHDFIFQTGSFSDVELVAVSIAGPQSLVALARFMQRLEVHDEVKFVVRAVRHPGVGIGIVGAWFVEDGQRLGMARSIYGDACSGE